MSEPTLTAGATDRTWSLAVVAAAADRTLRDEIAAELADLGPVEAGEDRDGVIGAADARCVVVVATPELAAAGWPRVGDALDGRAIAIPRVPGGDAGFGGFPIAPDRALLRRWIGAHREGAPLPEVAGAVDPAPAYPTPAARVAGERLAALYRLSETDPDRWRAELATARAALPRLQAGSFLGDGRWRLLGRQAPDTWEAWDRERRERVAIELHPDPVGSDEPGARTAELRRVAEAAPPGTLPIHHLGREGATGFAVRAWRRHSLREAASSPIAAVQLALEVASALGALHALGVVHGRVDPDAVWVDDDGAAALAAVGSPAAPTRSVYSAPESLEPGWTPTPAADVFGLGMLLLRAIHGAELPFWVLRDPERLIGGLAVPSVVKEVVRSAVDWSIEARLAAPAAVSAALLADRRLVGELARAAEAAGRVGVAIDHVARLLDGAEPSERSALHAQLASLAERAGEPDAARRHLQSALAGADDPEPILAQLRGSADPRFLGEVLEEEAARRPPEVAARLLAELARLRQGQLAEPMEAAGTWQRVLEEHRHPEQAAEALAALAALARERGGWESFIAHSRDLLAFAPAADRPAIQHAIGAAYLAGLGDEQSALQWLDRAEAGGYSSIDLARQIEAIRARRGQWGQAIALARRQAEVQPRADAAATLLRAASLARSVHLQDVTPLFEAVLAADPTSEPALRHLARVEARAGRLEAACERMALLIDSHRGTAADRFDLAGWLAALGRPDDAWRHASAGVELDPTHVPGRLLAASLAFDRGEGERARALWTAIAASFAGSSPSPQLLAATAGLAELAWLEGDLVDAQRRFDELIELDHESAAGWWGLAKVALAARAEGAGRDAPWVEALPERYTPFEALARLLLGTVDPAALTTWTAAWGAGAPKGDASDARRACCAVDLLFRADELGELFNALWGAFPEWSRAIEAVHDLWADSSHHADGFPVQRSYRWSVARTGRAPGEPDRERPRSVMAAPVLGRPAPLRRAADRSIARDFDHWALLLAGARPPGPDAEALPSEPPTETSLAAARIPALLYADGALAAAMPRSADELSIGGDEGSTPRIASAAPRHARLFRAGPYVYAQAVDGEVRVGGSPITALRLLGGESVEIADQRLTFAWFDREDELPAAGAPPPATPGIDDDDPLDEWTDDSAPSAPLPAWPTDGTSAPPARPRGVLPVQKVRAAIEVMSGPERGFTRVVEGQLTIGRGRESDVHLASDTQLSRVHCRVVERDGEYVLVDNQSTRGTVVNGRRIDEIPLVGGEVIMAGSTVLSFKLMENGPDLSDDTTEIRGEGS